MKGIWKKILKRKPEPRDIINLTVIFLLAGFFIWLSVRYAGSFGTFDIHDLTGSAEQIRAFVQSYGNAGLLSLVVLQAIQVIVSIIPSVLVQFAGGLIYGMGWGMITGIVGVAAGTAVSFYLARGLGREVLTLFISEKNIKKMEELFSGQLSALILLVLFILPTPKDFFAYFVGLTHMKASRFFLISAVGRLPGMLMATYLGAHVFDQNYVMIITVSVLSSALFLVLFLYRNKIMQALNHRKNNG